MGTLLLRYIVLSCAFITPCQAALLLEKVIDGDTVRLTEDGHRFVLRLRNIDAPELQQAFGKQSQRSLRRLCSGQIGVVLTGVDRYRRQLGDLTCDAQDAALYQVTHGMAWAGLRLAKSHPIIQAERAAQAQRIGLWQADAPMPPWQWRQQFGHVYHPKN